MAVKFSKVNFNLVHRVRTLAKSSFDNGDYIGAFVLQILFLEGTLSLATGLLLEGRSVEDDIKKKITEGYSSFATLADYFFLLTTNRKIYDELKTLNRRRNRVIHELLEFETFDTLQQESRELYLKSKDLEDHIHKDYVVPNVEKDDEPEAGPKPQSGNESHKISS